MKYIFFILFLMIVSRLFQVIRQSDKENDSTVNNTNEPSSKTLQPPRRSNTVASYSSESGLTSSYQAKANINNSSRCYSCKSTLNCLNNIMCSCCGLFICHKCGACEHNCSESKFRANKVMALGAVAIIASTVNAKRNGSNNSDAKETSSVSVHEEFAADFDYMECELNHTNNISECYIAYEEYEFDDYESEVDTGTDWGYPEGLE